MTFELSFGHNSCYKYSDGSGKLILDIYFLRFFQWYKEVFNPMNFDLSNRFLNISDSIRSPTFKMKVHLGVWRFIPSPFFTFSWMWMWLPGYTISSHLSMPLLRVVTVEPPNVFSIFPRYHLLLSSSCTPISWLLELFLIVNSQESKSHFSWWTYVLVSLFISILDVVLLLHTTLV